MLAGILAQEPSDSFHDVSLLYSVLEKERIGDAADDDSDLQTSLCSSSPPGGGQKQQEGATGETTTRLTCTFSGIP